MSARFTATSVLGIAGVKRRATGLELCRALVNAPGCAGAIDCAAYSFLWLSGSGRAPECVPASAGECAKLIASFANKVGHASIETFANLIREWNNARRSHVEASVDRAGEEPALSE